MELDEFKNYWNAVQQEEPKDRKHTPETLNRIILNTTDTLGELQEKSSFWKTIGSWNSALMLLLVFGYCIMLYYKGETSQVIISRLPLLTVLVVFALFSNWVYKRQEEIFSAVTDKSIKEGIKDTLLNFKRYYRFSNLVLILLAPVAFYAIFELFLSGLGLPLSSIILVSIGLTAFSFGVRFWYYYTIYFKRIKAMEANLRELEIE